MSSRHAALSEVSGEAGNGRGRKQWWGVHDGRFRAPLQLALDSHSLGFRPILLAASPKGTQTLTEQE